MSGDIDGDGTGHARRRVVIVDDHRAFTELLGMALSYESDLDCIATANNAADGVTMAQDLQPDIVILDIVMPGQDGLSAAQSIRDAAPLAMIVVVTAHTEPHWVMRSTESGASAFVPKTGSLDEMLEILRRVQPGWMLVAPSAFPADQPDPAPKRPETPTLTPREREVLDCLGQGLNPNAIALLLGISINTARTYVKSLLSKLGVNTKLQAVLKAQTLGLIEREG